MTQARANGIDIEYQENGPADGDVILLIMGLGMQLIAWPDAFCEGLAARGFRVIRFDNRDAGLSSRMRHASLLPTGVLMAAAYFGLPVRASYGLKDMAEDALGLMDALGVRRAHVVGVSMGGMIAQILAAEHPDRVESLVSIMSSSGDPKLPGPTPDVARALLRRRHRNDPERAIVEMAHFLRMISSPGFPTGEAELHKKVEVSLKRSFRPGGVARQMLAIQTSGSRVALLRKIRAPTLVIHGAEDPLIPLAAGEHTASQIAGARLLVIPGMGHDLPTALLPRLVDEIANHCGNAGAMTRPDRTHSEAEHRQ